MYLKESAGIGGACSVKMKRFRVWVLGALDCLKPTGAAAMDRCGPTSTPSCLAELCSVGRHLPALNSHNQGFRRCYVWGAANFTLCDVEYRTLEALTSVYCRHSFGVFQEGSEASRCVFYRPG